MKDKFQMVGNKIPEFELPNSRGETINIKDFEGKKNVVVILLRSIHWPYCRAHVGRLRNDFAKFEELNAFLYPILVDGEKNASKMEQKYAARKFAIFYDEKNEVSKVLHQEKKILKLGRMPGLLVVDKEGIVQYAYYSDSMKDIPKNEWILEVLQKLQD